MKRLIKDILWGVFLAALIWVCWPLHLHAAQAPTPIMGFVKTQLGNQVTITYTDSTKATIATITYSDGTVITVTAGTTTDVYTRTN